MKLDETDKKILDIIQADGRITNAKLASTIGISPPAMLERVRRLESSGIISKYVALLDRDRIGLGVMAMVTISLAIHQLPSIKSIENKILEMDEVLECYQTSGSEDYILKVALNDIRQFSDFCFQKLATIPGVQNIKSSFIISTVKSTTRLPVKAQR
ncbi:MAG: Lrp/AsnC family transcriptional regulator [Deltaproteobacteria bacterium]|nr:Lrp/AsnC family transcriptional regulator [Deltaproteobacteria bacterium]